MKRNLGKSIDEVCGYPPGTWHKFLNSESVREKFLSGFYSKFGENTTIMKNGTIIENYEHLNYGQTVDIINENPKPYFIEIKPHGETENYIVPKRNVRINRD